MTRRYACIDCSHPTSRYRCRRCQCRETHQFTHRKETPMNTTPTNGDIGEGEEVELEPLEIPQPEPAPQKVPA